MDLGSVLSRVSGKLSGNNNHGVAYLAVKISSLSVLAAAWSIENGNVAIGQIGSGEIEKNDWDGLLKGADKAVSTALPAESTVAAKTVFAVPFDWVVDGKIEASHLADLRRLCKELDLSPQGFVVTSEALENYYKETEGAPLTAILIGIDGKNGFLTTYRAGVNLGTTKFDWPEGDIAPAVEKVLKAMTKVEVLPSRIIIYDGKGDLESVAEKLTAHPWTKQLPFLHFPKVEIVPAESAVKAVAVAGGVQLGGKFELGIEDQPKEAAASGPLPAPNNISTPEPETQSPPELEEVSLEEAGFSSEDILPEEPVAGPEIPKTAVSAELAQNATFGQIRDLATEASISTPQITNKFKPGIEINKITAKIVKMVQPLIQKIRNFIPKKLAMNQSGGGSNPRNKAMLIVIPVLALIAFGALAYFVPKVTAIIKVTPKPFDHVAEIIVTTDSSKVATSSSAVLAGSFLDVSEIGTKKGVASGSKLVGNPAKGSVTIFGVSNSKTFAAGTVLSTTDGLKITLDHEVSVASGDAITPSTISTTVTAASIGDNYNFPAGTKFSIAGLSSSQYLAKNDSALTGGNSHQATVITKDDQERLMATLSAELAEKARSDLQSQLPPGQSLLPNAMTTTITQKKFSKDVDAEADTVSLDLSADYRGVIFSQADLIAIFAQQFSSEIPAGFTLPANLSQTEVKSAKNDKSGNSILSIHLTGSVMPIIDQKELIDRISGKSLTNAVTVIRQLPSVSAVSIETQPRVLNFISNFSLPWKKTNITVEIVSD